MVVALVAVGVYEIVSSNCSLDGIEVGNLCISTVEESQAKGCGRYIG